MLLAIDTATPQIGVTLWADGGPVASFELAGGRRHGELLVPTIHSLLAAVGSTPSGLDAVAVDVGPGLFTGLRVGLATAKALVAALGIPAVARTSLEILAEPHRRAPGVVAAVVDARRGEVFRALYRDGVQVAPPSVADPAALAAELGGLGAQVLAVGDGALRYRDVLAGVEVGGPLDAHFRAAVLAGMAAAHLDSGAATLDAAGLLPCYLRDADVRIGWAQRPEVAARG